MGVHRFPFENLFALDIFVCVFVCCYERVPAETKEKNTAHTPPGEGASNTVLATHFSATPPAAPVLVLLVYRCVRMRLDSHCSCQNDGVVLRYRHFTEYQRAE